MAHLSETQLRQCAEAAVDGRLAELAAAQHGVVSLTQLRGLGLGARAAQYRGARGRLHRVHRGVYAVGHRLLSPDGNRVAAVLACGPGAVLSHRSAAAAWGIRASHRARIEVTRTGRGRVSPRIEIHGVVSLAPDDTTHLRAIPITSLARTLVDLAAVIPEPALERAVHEAEVLRLLDVAAVHAAIARAPNRRGIAALRAILGTPSPGPTRSALERRFLALCRGGDLPMPRLNAWVALDERRVEVDALWEPERLIVELDGAATHHTTRRFHEDRRRDAALAARGYVVVRLTWPRVAGEPDAVVEELGRVLALRRAFAAHHDAAYG
jgi:very-short-patch-repair endonuclease